MSTIDELDDLMAELANAQTSGRTAIDRHREFRQVFMGSEAGQRVLHDIMALGHIWKNTALKDPYQTYRISGERELALKILSVVHIEPRPQPDRTKNKP